MFKLIGLKWKQEFEQLKSLHDIEMKKAESQLRLLANEKAQEFQLMEAKLTQKHELALTEATQLMKLSYQQEMKQKDLDYQRQINELKAGHLVDQATFRQKLQDDNYERLKDAMGKLHEEGNVTTKFTHELALKMLDRVPVAKSEHKYLQGDVSVDLNPSANK